MTLNAPDVLRRRFSDILTKLNEFFKFFKASCELMLISTLKSKTITTSTTLANFAC